MRFVFRAEVPLMAGEVFERLRHYERLYPAMHPAHEQPAAGHVPALLAADARFRVAERFGVERRTYDFQVTRFDPRTPALTLEAATRTTWGPLALKSRLIVDFAFEPTPGGCAVCVTQTLSLGPAWLDAWLSHPALWRGVAAHADAECQASLALLTDTEFYAAV